MSRAASPSDSIYSSPSGTAFCRRSRTGISTGVTAINPDATNGEHCSGTLNKRTDPSRNAWRRAARASRSRCS